MTYSTASTKERHTSKLTPLRVRENEPYVKVNTTCRQREPYAEDDTV